jgi:Ca-activated chloride channel family protein
LFSIRKHFFAGPILLVPVRWYIGRVGAGWVNKVRKKPLSLILKGGNMSLGAKTGTGICAVAIMVAISIALIATSGRCQTIEQIKGPIILLKDSVTGYTATLSPERSLYNVVVTDGLAHIQLTQMYVNRFGRIKDIVYVFPLPNMGSVHSMAMEYHDSLYQAKIYKKEEAQAKYDSVVNSGGSGALLIQDRPNIFQQHLANIAKGDTAYIRIGISMPLKYNNGEYELAIPTMIGERYQSEGQSYVPSSGTLWNPPADRDGQGLIVNVLVQTGFPIIGLSSPTHPLKNGTLEQIRPELELSGVITKESQIQSRYVCGAVLLSQTTYPNKDYVLRYSRKDAERDFTLASYYDTKNKAGYFAMNIFPDTAIFNGARPNIELVLLIDRSGSQGGWPIEKEKEISLWLLNHLLPTDRVAVLAFNTSLSWAFDNANAVTATSANITKAKSFVKDIGSDGGTDLLSGVNAALATPQTSEHERFYVFLTDGFVTNEADIIAAIKTHPSHPTVFTFGCGNSINRYLIDEAAATGSGGYGAVITQNESVAPFAASAWDKIESPQMKNITVDFGSIGADFIVMPSGTNLFTGRPVEIYGQYLTGGSTVVTVKGDCAGKQFELKKDVVFATQENMNGMVPKVWARQLIEKLSIEEGTTAKYKDNIIEISIAQQVLSKYTAFLAINPQQVSADESMKNQMLVEILEEERSTVFTKIKNMVRGFALSVINGLLRITMPSMAVIEEFRVFDLSGKCLYTFRIPGLTQVSHFEWNGRLAGGARLSAGCYVAAVKSSMGLYQKQFVWK